MLLAVRLDDGTEVLRSAKAGSLEAEALRLDDSLRATFEALKMWCLRERQLRNCCWHTGQRSLAGSSSSISIDSF